MCRFKTPPCVASHSTQAFCRYTRRRFESTHGSVLNLHTHTHKTPTTERGTDTNRRLSSHLHLSSHVCLSRFSSKSLLTCLYLFSYVPLSLSLPLLVFLSLSLLNDDDNEHSSSWLSVHTRPYLALRARGRGPWSIPCPVNMFASCKKLLSENSSASLVPLGVKWACICAEKKNVLGVVWWTLLCVFVCACWYVLVCDAVCCHRL